MIALRREEIQNIVLNETYEGYDMCILLGGKQWKQEWIGTKILIVGKK